MRKSLLLSIFALCFITYQPSHAAGNLGEGHFVGEGSYSLSFPAGINYDHRYDQRYNLNINMTNDSLGWEAVATSSSTPWTYTMKWSSEGTEADGTESYDVSIDSQSQGKFKCKGNRCVLEGVGTCEVGEICNWSMFLHKKSDTSLQVTTFADYRVNTWVSRNGGIARDTITVSGMFFGRLHQTGSAQAVELPTQGSFLMPSNSGMNDLSCLK